MTQPWHRDRDTRRFLMRYVLVVTALMLAWEVLQLPLYTIWHEAEASYLAFAAAHCTAEDALIGTAALLVVLVATRAGGIASWRWMLIAAVTTVIGVAYTLASEWLNASVRQSWQYSAVMPTVEVSGVAIGLSPLLQWIALPPLAFYAARRMGRRTA